MNSIFLYTVLLCGIVQACPSEDWDLYEDNCYKFYPGGTQPWNIAELICIDEGAHLASLSSDAEAFYIHFKMTHNNPQPPLPNYWVGLLRQGPGNDFAWTDDSPYNYQRWMPGQPNDYGGDDDCGRVGVADEGTDAETYWNDVECERFYGWVCKVPKGVNRKKGIDDSVKEYPSLSHPMEVVGQTSEDSWSTDGLSTGATAGIVLGGLVAFVCVGTIVFMMMYRRKKMAQQAPSVISVDMANNHI